MYGLSFSERETTLVGIKSYLKTEWLMPLQVPIDLNNAEHQYIFRAVNLIFYAHTLEPTCGPIVSSFRDITHKALSSLCDAQQDVAALLDRCAGLLDSGQQLDEEVRSQIRKMAASFDALRVAIEASEDSILSMEEPLVSIMRDKYGPRPTSIYARWFGKPSKGTIFTEALPTKLQDLIDRLHDLKESAERYEEHIQCMCIQLLGVANGSEGEAIARMLRLLTLVMGICCAGVQPHIWNLDSQSTFLSGRRVPGWSYPVLLRIEDDIMRHDLYETMEERDVFYRDFSVGLTLVPHTPSNNAAEVILRK